MPRGYRGTVFALGLVALFVICAGGGSLLIERANRAQLDIERQAKAKADYYSNRADIAEKRRCLPLSAKSEIDCIREERDSAREGQRSEYDLEAQRVMASWTRYMGIAAIIGMSASIFGIGLVFVTFRETRNAANAARQTHQAFVDVERPRLVISIGDAWVTEGGAGRIKITLTATNLGKTSAYVTAVRWDIQGTNLRLLPECVVSPVGMDVPAGGTKDILDITPARVAKRVHFLAGAVVYGSPFRADHEAHFCFRRGDIPDGNYSSAMIEMIADKGDHWPKDT